MTSNPMNTQELSMICHSIEVEILNSIPCSGNPRGFTIRVEKTWNLPNKISCKCPMQHVYHPIFKSLWPNEYEKHLCWSYSYICPNSLLLFKTLAKKSFYNRNEMNGNKQSNNLLEINYCHVATEVMKRFKIEDTTKRNRKKVHQDKPVEVLLQGFHKLDII